MGKSLAHKGYVGPADGAPVTPSIIHLYQHGTNHGPQAIVGNVEGLTAIRDAINGLLKVAGDISIKIEAVPGDDGEGYTLGLYKLDKPFTDRVWGDLPDTYTIPERGIGDRIWAVDCAVQQQWPCPKCHGFGKMGERTVETPHRMFLDYPPDAPQCDGPCKGTGFVSEKPSETEEKED